MYGNVKVDVYGKKNTNCKTTETDLVCTNFDGGNYTPSKNWIHVSCGDFEPTPTKQNPFKSTYKYFNDQKVSIVKDGKEIFTGSFEELSAKLEQK